MWAIGIKIGASPLHLGNSPDCANPVLTAADVTDAPALFVADPFMIPQQSGWFMFFEVMNAVTRRGEIAVAASRDGFRWQYLQIVLREEYHLSYPYVFEQEGEIFMIPETRRLERVLVYRAVRFPFEWRLHAELPDVAGADPSVFRCQGRLWMFVCSHAHDVLRLYSAPALEGRWTEHPASPVIIDDPSCARPAGRVIVERSRILRFAQDCRGDYGTAVRAFEVLELNPSTYRERECLESPILSPSGSGWDSLRTHHVDAHQLDQGRWIACVDGSSVHEHEWIVPAAARG